MKKVLLTAVLRKEGDFYVALCPESGTASQGNTVTDELHLEDNADEIDWLENEQPIVTTFEVEIGQTEPSLR